jgi:hypothetical protein
MANPILQAALNYRKAGLSTIPVFPETKTPIVPWKTYQERQPTEGELREMFKKAKAIGIVTGKVSGNLEVIDFDNKAELFPIWKEIVNQEAPGLLERLLIQKSQSDGRHIGYRCPDVQIPGNTKLAQRGVDVTPAVLGRLQILGIDPSDHDAVKQALPSLEVEISGKKHIPRLIDGKFIAVITLIETRGEGGQFLAEPSPGYKLIQGGFAEIPEFTTEERRILIEAARSLNAWVDRQRVEGYGPRLPKETQRPGDDFNERGDVARILVKHGWQPVGAKGVYQHYRRPGKDRGQSASLIDGKWFYNFSSNAYPFEPEKTYAPFAVYAYLECDGDFIKTASNLAQMGFGNKQMTGGEWPVLAQEAHYGLAGEFVRLVEPHTESDTVALLMQFLTGFGNLIGKGAYAKVEADTHYCNLYGVAVGESSKSRKGTSWGQVKLPLTTVDPGWKSRVKSGLSSGEGLIFQVRDPIMKREAKKQKGQTVYEDVIVDPGEDDKRLLVVESEFANVLRQLAREGNILSPVMRDAWDTGDLGTLTKNSPTKATGAHVSIIGHITKGELKRYLTRTEAGNGFGNRILWFCVKRSKVLPEGGRIYEVDFAPFLKRLGEAIFFAQCAGVVTRTPEARSLWAKVYPDLSEGKPGLVGALTSRAEAQVLRLSMIYALLDAEKFVRVPHLLAALTVWDYCETSVRYIFGQAIGDPVADVILEALKVAPDGLTRTEISNNLFGRHETAERIQLAVGELLGRGLITIETIETTGRPTEKLKYTGSAKKANYAK